MFDHLLESSHRDDSNKWSNIGLSVDIMQVVLVEVDFTHLIWISDEKKQIKLKVIQFVSQTLLQKVPSLQSRKQMTWPGEVGEQGGLEVLPWQP